MSVGAVASALNLPSQTPKGMTVEIRIGVQNTSREVVLESNLTSDEVMKAAQSAIESGGILNLKDDRGRTVLVPAASIAYIDIAAAESRKVGFGS